MIFTLINCFRDKTLFLSEILYSTVSLNISISTGSGCSAAHTAGQAGNACLGLRWYVSLYLRSHRPVAIHDRRLTSCNGNKHSMLQASKSVLRLRRGSERSSVHMSCKRKPFSPRYHSLMTRWRPNARPSHAKCWETIWRWCVSRV